MPGFPIFSFSISKSFDYIMYYLPFLFTKVFKSPVNSFGVIWAVTWFQFLYMCLYRAALCLFGTRVFFFCANTIVRKTIRRNQTFAILIAVIWFKWCNKIPYRILLLALWNLHIAITLHITFHWYKVFFLKKRFSFSRIQILSIRTGPSVSTTCKNLFSLNFTMALKNKLP